MALRAGDVILNGKYRILRLIGEGGMARVWLAEELRFWGRRVAIKEPRADLPPGQKKEVQERFHREVQVCAALEQVKVPNVVRAITTEMHDNNLLLVMEYMPGGDLAALLREHPDGLPIEEALTITLDLLRALEGVHGHSLEIVHRDIKPSNTLFDDKGRAHLVDFGLAQLAGMSGRSRLQGGQHPGTPLYMAPEQEASTRVLSAAADLYAVGCVLFEMLTGQRYKRHRPGTSAQGLRSEVPAWLDGILAKALAETSWDRWQSAIEMSRALELARSKAEERAYRAARAEEQRQKVLACQGAGAGVAAGEEAGASRKAPKRARSVWTRAPVIAMAAVVVALVAAGAFLIYPLLPIDHGTPTAFPSETLTSLATTAASTNQPEPSQVIVLTSEIQTTEQPTIPSGAETPAKAAETPAKAADTPTNTPDLEPSATPAQTETPTKRPTNPPTLIPTKKPVTKTPCPAAEPGLVASFETFGTWKRGDEPNGTFVQSSARVHQGSYAGKLDYQFNEPGNDYVVFQQTHPIAGRPTHITAWVYGDASGHFLNVWIRDNANQVWQVPLGKVTFTGWQQMVGVMDTDQAWPWCHIRGPDNGKVDYPVSFVALVLDDRPDSFIGGGTIYVDDIWADSSNVSPTPTGEPAQVAIDTPTSQAPTGDVAGRIAFSAGGWLYIVKAANGEYTVSPIRYMRQPDFRSDGQQIIAKGFQGEKTSLWTIDANTGAFIREQSDFTDDFRPFWSPDGTWFVYDSLHQGLGNFTLYKNAVDTKKDQYISCNGMAIIGKSPVWMHDGWIAFTGCDYWPGGNNGANCGIYRIPGWTGCPSLVQAGGLGMRATDNHGSQLLYMSQESGNWEVYLIPNQGGSARNLSNSKNSHDGLGTFSPDGKWVAFASNRGGEWAIWAVRLDGTGVNKLFTLPEPLTGDWTEEHISWGP